MNYQLKNFAADHNLFQEGLDEVELQ